MYHIFYALLVAVQPSVAGNRAYDCETYIEKGENL